MHKYFGMIPVVLLVFMSYQLTYGQSMGKVSIRFDEQEPTEYNITGALLYQNVSLNYDTTSQIQDDNGTLYLYYPQFKDGSSNVLRLIMARPDNREHFYDLFINLGDSLQEEIQFNGADSLVFWGEDGRLVPMKIYSHQIQGSVQLDKAQVGLRVTGRLALEFNYGLDSLTHISVNGNFDVPVGKFREASITTGAPDKEKKAHYRRNLYAAIIISAILIAIFGFK